MSKEAASPGETTNQRRKKVAIFGFSYKKNTSDTRCTPAATIVARLAQSGFDVAIHDPQVTRVGFEVEMIAQGYEHLISDDKEPSLNTKNSY